MVRSSALRRANLHLRKHRKWPLSPYKAKWHQTLDQQQAMENFRQSLTTPPTQQQQQQAHQNSNQPHMLSSLLHSFGLYECEPTPQAYNFVIKTLAEASQFCEISSVLDHIEKNENFEAPEYVFTDLIRIYADSGRIQDAINLFYRVPKFRCVPSVKTLNALLSVLCRNKEWVKMVPEVLMKTPLMSIRIEKSSFRILIRALCRTNRVGFAIEILNCMINDGFCVDAKTCSLILLSVCEQKDLSSDEVLRFYRELKRLGFCFGMVDYTNVIKSLVKKEKVSDALIILNQMKLEGIKPDIVCYTMVLRGVIAAEDYAKAEELFDELLVLGLVPDAYTYNVYIHGLCKQNNVDAGIKMIFCMGELGCEPDVITYNTLLHGLCKMGELNRSRELVKEMKLKGIEPNLHTYSIIIGGLVNKCEIIEACGLLEKVLDEGFCPPSLLFEETICGLCQKGLVCEALKLLQKMADKSISPGARVWDALLLNSGSQFGFADTSFIKLLD